MALQSAQAAIFNTDGGSSFCEETHTCGLLRDCCTEDSECFSGCCNSVYSMCTDISVCGTREGYEPPEPSTTPLFKYLQSKSKTKINPYEAVAKVEELLWTKQCYTYAITNNATLFQYNPVTHAFKVPTDSEYEYSEKSLLKWANQGQFGFGV